MALLRQVVTTDRESSPRCRESSRHPASQSPCPIGVQKERRFLHRGIVAASMKLNLAASKAVKEKKLGQNLGKELKQFRQEITVAGL